jgi:hypothetical protein
MFSRISLSEMKTNDVKNSYCPKITRVHIGRTDCTNSIKINWSWYNLILNCQSLYLYAVAKSFKKLPWEVHFRDFTVAMSRLCLPTVAIATGPTYQRHKVAMGAVM